MNGLPPPQSIQVLKNSDQYLIFSCADGDARCVYKMSYRNNDKLLKEMYRIQALASAYPSVRARLPAFLRHGTIEAGIHTGRAYFAQEYIDGTTFSHYVQKNNPSTQEFQMVVSTIVHTLADITLGHALNPAYDKRGGSWFKEAILYECRRLQTLRAIEHITALPSITIDGTQYRSLVDAVERVLSSNICGKLDKLPSFISALGHWNFHGDNVIFKDAAEVQNFKVIDPDVKIEECDPLFGLARFFYSFPHDTADYTQYLIHSDVFAGTSEHTSEFRITYLWPQIVYQHYATLLKAATPGGEDMLVAMDSRFTVEDIRARLQLCMLFCLLRGVYANYEEQIEFVGGRLTEFRNKSIYLYLQAVMFANKLAAAYRV